jgi:hypothetical protein
MKTAEINRKLLSVDECGAITGLSPWWFRRAAYAGRIESVKFGQRRLMIPATEVDRIIAEGTRPRTDSAA